MKVLKGAGSPTLPGAPPVMDDDTLIRLADEQALALSYLTRALLTLP
jgi:hypothetical protein